MRLLFVTPRFPWPPLKGDQVPAYHRLRLLSRRHEITLVSFVAGGEDTAPIEPFCERIETVRLPAWRSVATMAVRGAVSRDPFQVSYYASRAFRRRVEEVVAAGRFDLVNGFLLRTAPYVAPLEGLPKVIDLIDSMQLAFARRVAGQRPPRRWLFAEELRRVRTYERSLGARFDELIVVAEADRAQLADEHVHVVPNGVDTEAFAPDPARRRPGTIVFSGNMAFPPNAEAVLWFADRCLPRVRERRPDARFVVAGADPGAAVRALAAREGIEVTGFVDSMPATLQTAAVAVAPMRTGSGMQNKLLEAMATGLPLVTTPLGNAGVGAAASAELLVEDEPDAFADAVAALLADPQRAEALGAAGRAFVEREYSWERSVADVERIYERTVAAHR